MRAKRIIEARTAPRVSASPLTHVLTNRILSEWEIARDAVLFDEEAVDLARIVQTVLDEQKNAVSLLTGAKNEKMTPWWRVTLALVALQVIILAAAWLLDWWRS
jgi:hypothetical protein